MGDRFIIARIAREYFGVTHESQRKAFFTKVMDA